MRKNSNPGVQNEAPREVLRHITALDGVRGVAILQVLVYHLLWSNQQTGGALTNAVAQLRVSGWTGVDLFFALSGFLITGILYDSLGDPHFFRNFYARRVFRIFPLYYGSLAVLAMISALLFADVARNLHLLGMLALYLQNTPPYLHIHPFPRVNFYTGHLWSLAVEEQFYLVWPVIVFLVRDRRRLIWTAAGLALMAPALRWWMLGHGASFEETYRMTVCRQDSLLAGAWLALVVRGPAREKVLRWAPVAFWAGVAICLGIGLSTTNFDWEKNRPINLYGYTVLGVLNAAWIALALRPASLVSRMMKARVLRFFGKYSFGIYVFHQPIGSALEDRLLGSGLWSHVHSRVLMHFGSMLVIVTLTVLLAMVSFRFCEMPFLKMNRFFNYERAALDRSVAPAAAMGT